MKYFISVIDNGEEPLAMAEINPRPRIVATDNPEDVLTFDTRVEANERAKLVENETGLKTHVNLRL